MIKQILLLIAILSLVVFAGCGVQEETTEEIDLPPEPPPPGQLADANLDVLTVTECQALQGTVTNIVGGYECEQGEMAIGAVEELTGDHLCCVA